ncbi:hypothetical protein U879_09840 [Defluviimonas sp. 20V17]|nr:hypothetical protein U879_09840 [Defluviimonas sp. 20V17]
MHDGPAPAFGLADGAAIFIMAAKGRAMPDDDRLIST